MRELPARAARNNLAAPCSPLLADAAWAELVGNRIRALRESAGLTQIQLARQTGLPQSHISRLESGQGSLTESALRKIAKALRVRRKRIDPCIGQDCAR